jgi:hypothetical protein
MGRQGGDGRAAVDRQQHGVAEGVEFQVAYSQGKQDRKQLFLEQPTSPSRDYNTVIT